MSPPKAFQQWANTLHKKKTKMNVGSFYFKALTWLENQQDRLWSVMWSGTYAPKGHFPSSHLNFC